MWTTGTLLASLFATLLVLDTLPSAWADDIVLATVAGAAGLAGLLGWARWERLEREVLAAFGWPGE